MGITNDLKEALREVEAYMRGLVDLVASALCSPE